jgi:hypothetical protein
MSLTRSALVVLAGMGLVILLAGTLPAEQGAPPPAGEEIAEPPDVGAPLPPGPPAGRGPQRAGGPRRYRQGLPNGPAIGPGHMPGPPGAMDRRGPRGPLHPPGPPRWPYNNWDVLQKSDPEMYKLLRDDYEMERQTRELAIQYRRASAEQRAEIKQQLGELVDKHFEVRQQRRRLELKRLEEELERLREAIEARNEARDDLVRQRVAEILGDQGGLEF